MSYLGRQADASVVKEEEGGIFGHGTDRRAKTKQDRIEGVIPIARLLIHNVADGGLQKLIGVAVHALGGAGRQQDLVNAPSLR